MKIYIGHSTKQDYQKELYEPIQNSSLMENNEIFFPHVTSNTTIETKDIIKSSDLFIAEVSFPSTGLGIELGFASSADIEILCIYKDGTIPSSALKFITNNFKVYKNSDELIKILSDYLKNKIN